MTDQLTVARVRELLAEVDQPLECAEFEDYADWSRDDKVIHESCAAVCKARFTLTVLPTGQAVGGCEWNQRGLAIDPWFRTTCGVDAYRKDDGPYCPKCGGKIKVIADCFVDDGHAGSPHETPKD